MFPEIKVVPYKLRMMISGLRVMFSRLRGVCSRLIHEIGDLKFLRDTFFKTEDERDYVCAKVSPNPLRFQDVFKNVILCRDIMYDF